MTQKLWHKNARFQAKNDVSPFVPHNESASAGLLIPGEVRGQRNFEPLVVMLYGRRGAGKTATMTALGAWFQQQFQKSGTPVHIAANYKVDFARYCSPYLIDELGDFPEWGQRLVVLIDEISAYTASERSTSRATLDIGVFLTQVRKRDVEIIFCTQFPQEISRRVYARSIFLSKSSNQAITKTPICIAMTIGGNGRVDGPVNPGPQLKKKQIGN